ncbi:MACPF domain-containing protein [Prunus yedoensis var. nudiflora]|uniref:MACPF domain-containing protein n=1 Tax=Prunus yedoensis var. nudiflora TaxID=2094558 RepID=A0A314Y7T4_PRUYE|nr:MACPF domain-containing protein [Prunus yedoensis var. nudiflora]
MEATQKPIEVRALEALGQGFDLSSDFRLKFSKGLNGSDGRLVVLNEANKRDIVIPSGGGVTIHGVPEDIRCDKGDRIRFKSDVLEFNQKTSRDQNKVEGGWFSGTEGNQENEKKSSSLVTTASYRGIGGKSAPSRGGEKARKREVRSPL